MNYNDVVVNTTIACMSGKVPCIIGTPGIGKSQIVKDVRKKWVEFYNSKVPKDEKISIDSIDIVILFGSLLKEGELGGIPVPSTITVEGKRKVINDYTTHVKMQKILDNDAEGKITLLFIDEINRCENAVQQELMQLILDKQINQTVLPESCTIICAGNPEQDEFNDYQVTIMNDALKNRMIFFDMTASVAEWLKWGGLSVDGVQNINDDILEFIADNPTMLNNPKTTESIKPTPRGCKMFSDIYENIIEFIDPDEREDVVFNQASGICGKNWATTFISFLRNKENPMVTVKEIFDSNDNEFSENILPKIRKEVPLRQSLLIDRIERYFETEFQSIKKDKNKSKKVSDRFVDVLSVIPKDLMVGCMKNLSKNNKNLFEFMMQSEDFMNIFFEANKAASAAVN